MSFLNFAQTRLTEKMRGKEKCEWSVLSTFHSSRYKLILSSDRTSIAKDEKKGEKKNCMPEWLPSWIELPMN